LQTNQQNTKKQAAFRSNAERAVTIAGENHKLDLPYFVLATQTNRTEGISCLRHS
jgi:MoxR-like ATPase